MIATSLGASTYEQLPAPEKKAVDSGLSKNKLQIDLKPEGKKIRSFYFYTEDPYSPIDKHLAWFETQTFRTQDSALQAQLWIQAGDDFDQAILVENEQVLLRPTIRSFARIMPVKPEGSPSSTEVDLLIVTRDVSSWQTTYNFAATGSTLTQLSLGVAQSNLLGLNKTVELDFSLGQALMNFSASYVDPILFSTKHQLSLQQGIFVSRQGFKYEGVNGAFVLQYPLGIESTPWGYSASLAYTYQPVYDFQGDKIRLYEGQERKYRQFTLNPSLVATRSFGATYKNNISFGYEFRLRRYAPLGSVSPNFIQNVLPYSESESFLILGYNYFQNQFLALCDYDTFALTEWVRLGPSVALTNHFAWTALGSDTDFIRPSLSIGFRLQTSKDSLLTLSSKTQTRFQGYFIDNNMSFISNFLSPILFKIGRFVWQSAYSVLWDNHNNSLLTLGGDLGLRGVPSRYYQGQNSVESNLEFRTRSLSLWIFRLGLVGFYDFGAAFNGRKDFNPTHDLGLGVRILTIPWNRSVIRIDIAVPVAGPLAGFSNITPSLGVGQAF